MDIEAIHVQSPSDVAEWIVWRDAERELLSRLTITNEMEEGPDGQVIVRDKNLSPETRIDIDSLVESVPTNSPLSRVLRQQKNQVVTSRIKIQVTHNLADVWDLDDQYFLTEKVRSKGYTTHLLVCSWHGQFRGSAKLPRFLCHSFLSAQSDRPQS